LYLNYACDVYAVYFTENRILSFALEIRVKIIVIDLYYLPRQNRPIFKTTKHYNFECTDVHYTYIFFNGLCTWILIFRSSHKYKRIRDRNHRTDYVSNDVSILIISFVIVVARRVPIPRLTGSISRRNREGGTVKFGVKDFVCETWHSRIVT